MKITTNPLWPETPEARWEDVFYPGTGMTEEALMSLPETLESNLSDAEALLTSLQKSIDSYYTVGISELEQVSQAVPAITNNLENVAAFYRQSPTETISDTFNSLDTIDTTTLSVDLLRGYVTRPISGVVEAQSKVVNVRLDHGSVGIPGNNSEISSISDTSEVANASHPSLTSLDEAMANLASSAASSNTPQVKTVADIGEDNHGSVMNAFDGNTDTVFEWERVTVDTTQNLGYAGYARVFGTGMNSADIYKTCSTGGWSGYVAWPDTQFNWGPSTVTATSGGTSITVYKPKEPLVRIIEESGGELPHYLLEIELDNAIDSINLDIDFLIRYTAVKIVNAQVSQDGINWRSVLTNETINATNNPIRIVVGKEDGANFKYIQLEMQALAWYVPPKGIAHPFITYATKVEERGYALGVCVSSKKYNVIQRGSITPYVLGTCPVTINGEKYILGRVATAYSTTSGAFEVGGKVDSIVPTIMALGAAAIAASQSVLSLTLGKSLVAAINVVAKTVGASIGRNLLTLPGNVVGWAIFGLDLLTGGAIGKFLTDLVWASSVKTFPKDAVAGNDILTGKRSSIAIRNIFLSNPNYVGSGELITKPYIFSKTYQRFVFDAKETGSCKYYIRSGTETTIDSAEWREITPAYRGDATSSVLVNEGDRCQVKISLDSGSPIVMAIFLEGAN